ncbi:uncharacterized protein A1O9_08241 [Exophiala aquamarina CBS 119918]|uniref:Gamma interferon inducible lysosomal thiol reductase n=1 Tax=Exophiala aquamarina CBS 119918 TaxID=1182545 RepID=A0A072P6J8_9EURO|nr:uncharacterized protein A1O9_08241 [Exophiala aquamarina CBS 119918]KEF55491.1 hypothetical protein A1O9_08241 [Exophiala aquamarina CBS 119918]
MAEQHSATAPGLDEKGLPYNQKWNFEPPGTDETKSTARDHVYKRVVPAILTILALFTIFRSAFVSDHHYDPSGREGLLRNIEEEVDEPKVELEAHGMSRCPDFRDCLRELILPTMEQVSHRVNFTLSFIGQIDPKSDAVSCMHGPAECLGNIIELCAAEIYPDPKIYLGFTNCLTSDYHNIPDRDLVEGCAMEHGIDFQKLNNCISDEGEGINLLRASISRSHENNVTKSCTVRLAGKIRCIRDGGKWYDCPGGSSVEDLVRDINALYK